MKIDFYDTTLRDGDESEDIAFSVNDKIRVTEKLDDFGMDFIEGGWPGRTRETWSISKRSKSSASATAGSWPSPAP